MRRLVPFLLLALAAGCGRDFSLPPTPTSHPQFLGPLAGFYRLDVPTEAVGPAGKQIDTTSAAGSVLVVQDLEPPNGGPNPVVGGFLEVASPTPHGADPQAGFTGTYADRKLTATRVFSQKKIGNKTVTEAVPLTATAIPGTDGLVIGFPTCPNETIPPLTIEARKVCNFEPQLSGTYSGHTGACGSTPGGSATYIGLGIRSMTPDGPAIVIGMGYPDTSNVFYGMYDRFSGCGGAAASSTGGVPSAADFSLTDDGKNLTLDLDEGPLSGLFGQDLCHPNLDSCTTHFVGTRKDGSTADTCHPPAIPGLVLRWKRDSGDPTLLDVSVYIAGVDEITAGSHFLTQNGDDRSLLHGSLTAADGSFGPKAAITSGLPNDVSMRFPLPAVGAKLHDYRIEVWADVAAGQIARVPVGAAMPACIRGSKL